MDFTGASTFDYFLLWLKTENFRFQKVITSLSGCRVVILVASISFLIFYATQVHMNVNLKILSLMIFATVLPVLMICTPTSKLSKILGCNGL